jgi:hypothetical protein
MGWKIRVVEKEEKYFRMESVDIEKAIIEYRIEHRHKLPKIILLNPIDLVSISIEWAASLNYEEEPISEDNDSYRYRGIRLVESPQVDLTTIEIY